MRTSEKMSGGGNRMSAPKMRHGMKSKGRKIRSMRIEPAKSGGYVVSHEMQPPDGEPYYGGPNEQHVVADKQALHDHIDTHMPDDGSDGE